MQPSPNMAVSEIVYCLLVHTTNNGQLRSSSNTGIHVFVDYV